MLYKKKNTKKIAKTKVKKAVRCKIMTPTR